MEAFIVDCHCEGSLKFSDELWRISLEFRQRNVLATACRLKLHFVSRVFEETVGDYFSIDCFIAVPTRRPVMDDSNLPSGRDVLDYSRAEALTLSWKDEDDMISGHDDLIGGISSFGQFVLGHDDLLLVVTMYHTSLQG
jgi:hypothetical protein